MNDFKDNDAIADSDAQLPLSMIAGENDAAAMPSFDASFAQKKSSMGGMMLIIMVLLIAAGVLGVMRMTGGVAGADKSLAEAEKKIDQALKKLAGTSEPGAAPAAGIEAIFKDADSVVTMFASDPSQKQVAPEQLQKNPFELFVAAKPAGGTSDSAAAIDKMKAERLKQIHKELEDLKLQSLLSGRKSLAVINGKVYNEGDMVGSFTIVSISPSGVRLTADGNTYTLQMEKPEGEGVHTGQ